MEVARYLVVRHFGHEQVFQLWQLFPMRAWRSLSDVPEQQKSSVFQVGPYFYNSSLVSLHSG